MRSIFGGIGVCHLFIDEKLDENEVFSIINNAKLQAPSVCNALDTLLIHEKQIKKLLPKIVSELNRNNVETRLDSKLFNLVKDIGPRKLIKKATDKDWGKEFLDLIVSIKSVKSIEEAIDHIDKHSFGHTDGIISKINKNINTFTQRVNSSAVTINASTRFNDGGEIGLGSEIAISTTKVSPRGPLGLEEITTYKWLIKGTVVSGDKRGREIGFPTANLEVNDFLQINFGVYAVKVEIDGMSYNGVSNYGIRPTFDGEKLLLETYLFDFSKDIYGKDIVVSFIEFIRKEKKFDGIDLLKEQIALDSKKAIKIMDK